MHNILLFLFSASLFLLLPFISQAQDSDQQPDTLVGEFSEFLIEATRLTETEGSAPFSVTVKRRSLAESRFEPALTLDRVLSDVPGLWVSNRENYALGQRISIRGMGWRAAFGVRGIYVMLDGIPLTMPDGQTGLDILDPAFVSQAEVIRGPSSSFWGNAGGGAIILSTKNMNDKPKARVRAYTGSYGTYKVEASAASKIGDHNYNIFGSYLDHNGFRDHSSHQALHLGGHAGFDLGTNTDLSLTGSFVDAPFTQHPGALNAEDARDTPRQATPGFVQASAGKSWRQGQAGATLTRRTNAGTITATTYGIARELHNPLTFAEIEVDRLVGGGRLAMQDNSGIISWGVGLDASVQQDDRRNYGYEGEFVRDELTLDQIETVSNTGVFSRIGTNWERFNISASLRYDHLVFDNNDMLLEDDDQSGSRNFSSFSPAAGVSYKLNTNLVYANFGTAFQSPTTTELVNRPDMTGGFNSELDPERTLGIEAGIRGRLNDSKLIYDIAAYSMEVRNRLISYQTEAGGARDFYRNEGLTQNTGIETFLEWQPIPQLTARTSYTWSRFTFEQEGIDAQLDGNRLPGIPEHRLASALQYSPSALWAALYMENVGEYFADDGNNISNAGYTVLDLQIGHQNLELSSNLIIQPFIKVNNIMDVRYNTSVSINAFGGRYFEPAPGRVFQAGFTVEL
ncbi:MAG: TonB-dependent receptor [Balneolales bacterium]